MVNERRRAPAARLLPSSHLAAEIMRPLTTFENL